MFQQQQWFHAELFLGVISLIGASSSPLSSGHLPRNLFQCSILKLSLLKHSRGSRIYLKSPLAFCLTFWLPHFQRCLHFLSASSETNWFCVPQSAARQGNRLHMNVYETRGQPARVSTTKASGAEPKRGFRPPQHCPTLAQVVSRKVQAAVPEQGMVRPHHTGLTD